MKNIVYTCILAATIIGCSTTKTPQENNTTPATTQNDTVRIANDSLEYEIIIIEPGFNNWLATQKPRGYYEQFWLETRNRLLVTQYNNRVYQPQQNHPNLYLQPINYENSVDYGYEVNYLLYHWFKFFQERYNQKLL